MRPVAANVRVDTGTAVDVEADGAVVGVLEGGAAVVDVGAVVVVVGAVVEVVVVV